MLGIIGEEGVRTELMESNGSIIVNLAHSILFKKSYKVMKKNVYHIPEFTR